MWATSSHRLMVPDSADLALRCLYPRDSGTTLDLSSDLEMSGVFSDLLAVRE